MKNTNNNNNNHDANKQVITSVRHNRMKRLHSESRRNLPVYEHKAEICSLVSKNFVLLVIAETGSGKSTQIPAFLHESGCLKHSAKNIPNERNNESIPTKRRLMAQSICVTQPRRVAAMTVAKRVAEEMGCSLGTVVGYRVRFDDCTDKNGPGSTKVVYATDGMLMKEATSDPLLSRYSAVVLDEAHERSLQTDILFGVVKRAMKARNEYHRKDKHSKEKLDKKEMDELIMDKMTDKARELQLPALRVVVMSATLDIETFANFFPDAARIQIPGRQFPVQILYTEEPQDDYIDSAISIVLQIIEEGESGDILVFLPGKIMCRPYEKNKTPYDMFLLPTNPACMLKSGQEEIEGMAALLKSHLDEEAEFSRSLSGSNPNAEDTQNVSQGDIVQALKGMGKDVNSTMNSLVHGVQVCVLYAALPPDIQMIAFQPKPSGCKRKVVLATNIAETSVTLSGIRYVIDCGKHKTRDFSGITGMESLTIENISQPQAAQRTGRAGRVSSGFCFRLYTEDSFSSLNKTTTPEILRVNLAHVILQLKTCGVSDPRKFDFITPPNIDTLRKAFELLYALGALDSKMDLTPHGKKMAKLPLDPIFSHLLLQSPKYECISEMLTTVSMLSITESIFFRPSGGSTMKDDEKTNSLASRAAAAHRRFISYEGDLPTLLAVYESWKQEAIYFPASHGGKKAQKKLLKQLQDKSGKTGISKILHGEWCMRNFINGRAITRANDVRNQLEEIVSRSVKKNGLGWDTSVSCGAEMEKFLRCACAGLFLQAASRIIHAESVKTQRQKRQKLLDDEDQSVLSGQGKYKTLNVMTQGEGKREVSIHPLSSLFGRNPAPKCVVYCELLQTKKVYIRGVTQVKEDWVHEMRDNISN